MIDVTLSSLSMLFISATDHLILYVRLLVTSKNVSWPSFIWPTLYTAFNPSVTVNGGDDDVDGKLTQVSAIKK